MPRRRLTGGRRKAMFDLRALLSNIWKNLPGMGPSEFTFTNPNLPTPSPTSTPTPTPQPTSPPMPQPMGQVAGVSQLGDRLPNFNLPDPQTSILDLILRASQETGVDANLLAGLLAQESMFNPQAIFGQQGNRDRGIAQISERWHPEVPDQQALDPNFAI